MEKEKGMPKYPEERIKTGEMEIPEINIESGRDRFVLMPIDPCNAYVYWDFKKETIEKIKERPGEKIEAILGLSSKSGCCSVPLTFDIENERTMSYYFHHLSQKIEYQASFKIPSIGLELKSNYITTPASGPCD